jgi:[calcium/calmodulin-dependent protein kinase] kinase
MHEATAAQREADKGALPPEKQALDDCPPSPDDDIHFPKGLATMSDVPTGPPMQTLPSASTIASSSVEEFAGGISQSTSNPSIPSVVSEASSVTAESFLPLDKAPDPKPGADFEPSFMRTAETIKARDHQDAQSIASGRPQEEPQYLNDDGDGDGDDEGDSSGDEFLMFGGPAKK